MSWNVCTSQKVLDSVQLQTVLAMYDQQIDLNQAMQSYQRLKTMVRRHTDQMIWTRNFIARNERIETGVLVKSHKESNWTVVSATEVIVDRKHNRPLLLQKRRHKLTEENPRKVLVAGYKSSSGRKGRKACKKIIKGQCANPSCDLWHPPVCQNYSLYRGANSATDVYLDTLKLMGSPARSR